MDKTLESRYLDMVNTFRFPTYQEIPDVGLFLEQVTKYISNILAPIPGVTITGSMVSNYIKKKLIDRPIKKQYSREQIAYLIFIAVAKTVLSLDDIQLFIRIQKQTYDTQVAYVYFCQEFENILHYVFGLKNAPDIVGQDSTDEKTMLHNMIVAVVYKVYLETRFALLRDRIEESLEQ